MCEKLILTSDQNVQGNSVIFDSELSEYGNLNYEGHRLRFQIILLHVSGMFEASKEGHLSAKCPLL